LKCPKWGRRCPVTKKEGEGRECQNTNGICPFGVTLNRSQKPAGKVFFTLLSAGTLKVAAFLNENPLFFRRGLSWASTEKIDTYLYSEGTCYGPDKEFRYSKFAQLVC
jgi:hypothetical protein